MYIFVYAVSTYVLCLDMLVNSRGKMPKCQTKMKNTFISGLAVSRD